MKKVLFIVTMVFLTTLSTATAFASPEVNLTGELDMKGEHSTFSDGEVSEEEWNAGQPGGSDGTEEPEADSPSITDRLGNLIGDLWDDAKDIAKNTANVVWDTITDGVDNALDVAADVGSWFKDKFNDITEWFNNLPDVWQDALLTLGAVVIAVVVVLGVIAIGAAIIAGGFVAIPAAIVLGVVIGAGLVGGAYFALNGGTDDFSFSHALMLAMGGGAVGAFLGTSAGGAFVTALARKFAPKFASEFMLVLRLGGKGMAARFLAGAWLKSLIVPMSGLFLFELMNFIVTGKLPTLRQFTSDFVLTIVTAPIGGHLGNRALSLFRNGKVFSGLLNGFVGMNVGGFANFMLGASGSGNGTWVDYAIGMLTAGIFMGAKPITDKFTTDESKKVMFEVIQKTVGGKISDIFKGKPKVLGGVQDTVNPSYNKKSLTNIGQINQTKTNTGIENLRIQNELTESEQKALQEYLDSLGAN